ncbi:MAG: alpha/beta hydrolase [Deltaproteobacteria bacterium]|nr:alpha/beta hydrolase [Deltaproteobacteria bacterium]MBW1953218.1 alpha/beta hydrolase [Deltaproteobacteria bacterium]MBW1985677.1 alpha/beta hydrolase [Deltaproteobacteria bacterium]MBW2134590.1 alpha/beta hydrolase [Deltaproteobacteria bacterium]
MPMLTPQKIAIDCIFHSPCIELNYYDQGAGEPLIFIHGLGGSATNWRFQMEELSPHCRTIAMDLRSHGQSGYRPEKSITIRTFADDIIALMTKLGLEQAHFCGLSMGGMIALELYLRYPGQVKSLILADTTAFFPDSQRLGEFLQLLDSMSMRDWAQLFSFLILRREAPAALRQELIDITAATRRGPYRQGLIATFSSDYRWLLPLIDVRTLILVGAEDQATPIGLAKYLQAQIPNAVLHLIPQSAHCTNLENPTEFNRHLLAHLDNWVK